MLDTNLGRPDLEMSTRKDLMEASANGARVVIQVTDRSEGLIGQVAGVHDDFFWFVTGQGHPRLIRIAALTSLRPATPAEVSAEQTLAPADSVSTAQ